MMEEKMATKAAGLAYKALEDKCGNGFRKVQNKAVYPYKQCIHM
jgi:hypothetical protein